ncbi:Zinc finger MYM-type protein 1 [Araneus ventricosus]|uniref:Zinc finger MYM-type protein 1 n=1 Tax=Araneus ventricosus TaxID=182803 RepID=A0A4Y2S918_ARAVE|nr:Zinc finger MYM-type protein 1 [Araneus ventricosus]
MNSGGRSMYTSSFIQNELINTFGHLIQSQIVRNVRKSIFYSVLADETTDISQIEQFSLCARYVEDQSYKIREDFLTFVPVYDITGAGLANTVLETLSILGLDLKKMRVQGYDGAATMRGQFRGVQASLKEKLPLALYTHRSSHSLNLCLSDASNIPSIRNCMGVIKDVCRFFHSAKRTEINDI